MPADETGEILDRDQSSRAWSPERARRCAKAICGPATLDLSRRAQMATSDYSGCPSRHAGAEDTDLRRLQSAVQADQAALRTRQAQLEDLLAAAPAENWADAVDKVRYLLGLLRDSDAGIDPRRRGLIDNVLADLDELLLQRANG
jgi:hypothetical protein